MSSDTTHPVSSPARPVRPALWVVPVVLAVLALWFSFHSWGRMKKYSGDFIDLQVYQLGIEAMRHGSDLYGQLPKTSAGIGLPFIYPPFAAIALQPFALLPWSVSKTLYVVLSVAALTWALYLVARRYRPEARETAVWITACALPLAMFLEPVRATIDFGQVNLLLMGLVAADCLTPKTRWPRGVLIGIAAAIKLTPAAFVLFFLIRKDYRAAVTAAATGIIATAASFLILHTESTRYWFGGLGNVSGLSGSDFHTNQSIQAVLARLGFDGFAFDALWIVLGLLVLALVVAAMRKAADAPALALSMNAVFTLLLSPISWSHHWVWIAPALFAMTLYAVRLPRRRALGWYATIAVTAAVFYYAPHNSLPGDKHLEQSWTPLQHIIGDTYVWLAVALIVLFLITGRRTTTPPTRPLDRSESEPVAVS